MTHRRLRLAWLLTAIAAVGLLLATMRLARLARSDEILVGKVVTLVGPNNLVFLREGPTRTANVLATVPWGTAGRVAAFEVTAGQETWFLVETAAGPGWVPDLLVERNAATDEP